MFPQDQRGAHVEAEPLCVLDFFVKENLQRHGYGLELFEFMLQVGHALERTCKGWNVTVGGFATTVREKKECLDVGGL